MMEWWTGGELYDGGTLQWLSSSSVIGLAVFLAVGTLVVSIWTGRPLDADQRGKRIVELSLWSLALSVLVIAIAQPAWVAESGRTELGRLVVLIDGSRSMTIEEGGGVRSDAVDPILDMLQEEHGNGPIEIFHFDESLEVGIPESYTGIDTDLGVALASIRDRFLGQSLRGVVVLTDGLDRGSLRREVRDARESAQLNTRLAPDLPGPLSVYQIGTDAGLMDVAIDDVITGGYAFQRTPFTLRVLLSGPPGHTVPVTLERDGNWVETQPVVLDEQGVAEIEFEHESVRAGRFAYMVSIPHDAEDAVPGNNRYPVVVRVVREKIRVLQVSGSPSYDQMFLRLFLQEDPSVDLVSFFILRTNEDLDTDWRSQELSLIEFPYERLFSDDLGSFDLVILQNFNYGPYFNWQAERLLGNIARAVENGETALVMTGGDRSFDLGDYAGTPIERVLPVHLGLSTVRTDLEKFQPNLTEAGLAHPITRLSSTYDSSIEIWSRLPEMDGLNLSVRAHEEAAVLLEHPTLRSSNGAPMPVLAVREVGQGRSMALTVDASWRWSFSEAAVGRGNQAYLHFWKNALRWLVGDPSERRVTVEPSRDNVLLGDAVRLVSRVRDASYQPLGDRELRLTVIGPDGTREEMDLRTDTTGEVVYEYTPIVRGPHQVDIVAGDGVMDRATTVFAATDRDPEMSEIRPDTTFLRQLVELYGPQGAWRPRGSMESALVDGAAIQQIPERSERPLGSIPLFALLFGLLSSAAWWFRRRAGGL